MKICTTLALAFALAAAGACKKDDKDSGGSTKVTDNKTPDPGSAQPPPPPPEVEKPLVGAALAQRYIECGALMTSDHAKFTSKCVAADAMMHDAGMGMEMKHADMAKMWEGIAKAFPDMKMQPQFIFVNGRTIAAVGFMTATHTGELDLTGMPGVPPGTKIAPTNKKLGQLFFHRLKLDDQNKATHDWYIDDHGQFGQIMGAPADAPHRPVMEKGLVDAPVIVVAADDDKEKANLAVWKKGTELTNTRDAKAFAELWTDDAVESDQAEVADVKGKKDIQKGFAALIKAFPDFKVETVEEWAAGDYVVMIGSATGTHNGPLGKIKKTGKAVKIPFAEVAQMKDGKIATLWRFRNSVDLAKQLGLIPDPMAPKAADPKAADPKAADPKAADPKKKDDTK